MAQFTLIRDRFNKSNTLGDLYYSQGGGETIHLTDMLEDPRRLPGVKVQDDTCIPSGNYKIVVTMSKRFKKRMPMIYNQANGYGLKAEGISFVGIRLHNGLHAGHTSGCPLYQIKGADKTVISIIDEDASKCIESWIEIVDEI